MGCIKIADYNGHKVAWKETSESEWKQNEDKMIKKEFEILQNLKHENIVKLFGYTKSVIENSSRYGIVLEYVDGISLEEGKFLCDTC